MKRQNYKNTNQPLPATIPTQAKASGLAYSLVISFVLVFSLVASLVLGIAGVKIDNNNKPDWYLYMSYLVPLLSIFLAIVIYFAWLKRPVKEVVKEQKCHPKYYIVAIFLQIGLLSLGNINEIFIGVLQDLGYKVPGPEIPNLNGFGLFATLFCVAVLPAVFEEFFFRGIVLKGLRNFDALSSVLLCGVLFSIYHQNPAQTIYQFACGAAFALIALRSGSVYPTMLAHFINNALIIILFRFGIDDLASIAYVPYVMITSLCLIGALGYLFFFDLPLEEPKKFDPAEEKKRAHVIRRQKEEEKAERVQFFVGASVGIAICAVLWLYTLFTSV